MNFNGLLLCFAGLSVALSYGMYFNARNYLESFSFTLRHFLMYAKLYSSIAFVNLVRSFIEPTKNSTYKYVHVTKSLSYNCSKEILCKKIRNIAFIFVYE